MEPLPPEAGRLSVVGSMRDLCTKLSWFEPVGARSACRLEPHYVRDEAGSGVKRMRKRRSYGGRRSRHNITSGKGALRSTMSSYAQTCRPRVNETGSHGAVPWSLSLRILGMQLRDLIFY